MSLDDAINELGNAVAKGDVSAIDRSVNAVLSYNCPDSIGPILRLLQDDSLYDEGMFSLIHAAESFDDDVYLVGVGRVELSNSMIGLQLRERPAMET